MQKFQIVALGFKRSSRLEGDMVERCCTVAEGGCTSRKVQAPAKGVTEGGVEQEEMRGSQTLSRVVEGQGRRQVSAKRRDGDGERVRAPGVCTLFRVSARAGNMTAVTSA